METLLTAKEAAEAVGVVTAATLRRWAEERQIRHVRLPSGQVRFRLSDLEAALTPVEPETEGAA